MRGLIGSSTFEGQVTISGALNTQFAEVMTWRDALLALKSL
jgi:hypothetical protein